jgi:hypothetical protein
MSIRFKTGSSGVKSRTLGDVDVDFTFDSSAIVYGASVFQGVFDFKDKNPEFISLDPDVATLDFGGAVVKKKDGIARFRVRSGGVWSQVVLDLTDPTVPPTVVDPQPPPTPPPTPTYSETLQYILDVSGPEIEGLIQDLPGGATNMNLWSVRSPSTKTYTRNPNFWAQPLVSQLTGVVAYKSPRAQQSYGGILISPRHVLYCDHAHPHAANTWLVNLGDSRPCVLQFVLGDGTVVEAIQLAQTTRRTARNLPGAYIPEDWPAGALVAPDLCVAVLDRDVAALGVHVMPIPNLTTQDAGYISSLNIPTCNVTQGYERATNKIPPIPISDYPQQNQAMFAIGRGSRGGTPYENFDYAVWDGDSGTPAMIMVDSTLYLERIILYGGGNGIQPALNLGHINAMLAVADADAVARGKMSEPTGLTITATTIPVSP